MKHLLLISLCGAALTAGAGDGPFALQFDGVNDHVAVRHSTAFNNGQLTVTAWIRTTQTVGEAGLVNKYVAGSLNGWNVFLFNGELRAWYFRDSANFIWDGGRGLNAGFVADGQWHHIAFVVNATEGRLYRDGLPFDARFWDGTAGSATTGQEVRLGNYPGSGFYNGLLDEVTVWSRALSGAEISATRSNSLVNAGFELQGYYRLTEGAGTTAANSGSAGFLFDGALMNGPLWVPGVVLKPGVSTQPANALTSSSAQLNGAASPGGTNASGWFEWGFTTSYGNVTSPQPLGGGGNVTNFTQSLTGLSFGTLVHFRAVASNSLGVAFGANESFRTLGPSVVTLPASSLTQTSATLNAAANPSGSSAIGWFEFGFTTNYDNVTPPQALGSGNASTNFSEVLTDLIPGASYHFRAVVSNSVGVVFGADQSFPNFAQRAYLKASNTGQSDNFGTSVAMSGDTLVVGARNESSNATGVNGDQNNNSAFLAGAAYVFVRDGDSWLQQAYLKASNNDGVPNRIGDQFGAAVAMSGDTIVVGAPGEDSNAIGFNGDQSNNSATNSGAAYVFVRSGTNWTQQAYLKASNTGQDDGFGNSVAVAGNIVVVGASGEDSGAIGVNGNGSDNSQTNSGAAYVFVRNGTTWTQQAYLKASNTEGHVSGFGDRFGVSVAVAGETVIVGANDEDSNATGVNGTQTNNSATTSGAAYVFVRNGTTWTQQAYLKASNTGSSDNFGISVTASGDTVVVGASSESSSATGVNGVQTNNLARFSGAAYVFMRNGTTWTQQAYLKASNTESNDSFGRSVALSGDLLVVGAIGEDSNATGVNGDQTNNSATFSGAAYVFTRNGTAWSFQDYLKASNTRMSDDFGNSVAAAEDTVVVAAFLEGSNATGVNGDQNNNNAGQSGAAYVFGPPLPPAPEIAVQINPLGVLTNVVDGGSSPQLVVAGSNTASQLFFIRNLGNGPLTLGGITFDGTDAAMFSLQTGLRPTLPPGTSFTNFITFSVRFAPTSTGVKTATLHLANNDPDENPFDINLTGLSLSFTEDTDGDGLNDATEFVLGTMVFDFQLNQSNLVKRLFSNLGGAISNVNAAGFFGLSQIQALNVDTLLLTRDPASGLFTLTIGVEKATLLTNFIAFPMTAPQTTINADGKLEFQFSTPDSAAFFRLESR